MAEPNNPTTPTSPARGSEPQPPPSAPEPANAQQAAPPPAAPPPSAPGLIDPENGEFFDQLDQLLNKLVPPDSVTVTTCDGTDLVLPGAIPARQQVKVFRLMRDLMELDQVGAALGGVGDIQSTTGIVDIIVGLATDEQVAEGLGAIFSNAYPDLLDGRDPLDVLPLEELVVSLIPFSERFVKRVGTGITALGRGATGLQSS